MRSTREDDFVLPLRAVCCPFCSDWVSVEGWTLVETLWMHEYDCSAIAKDYELQLAA